MVESATVGGPPTPRTQIFFKPELTSRLIPIRLPHNSGTTPPYASVWFDHKTAIPLCLRAQFVFVCIGTSLNVIYLPVNNKKGQLSLTNPRDACEKFPRFT